jgi:hypothetical protein
MTTLHSNVRKTTHTSKIHNYAATLGESHISVIKKDHCEVWDPHHGMKISVFWDVILCGLVVNTYSL